MKIAEWNGQASSESNQSVPSFLNSFFSFQRRARFCVKLPLCPYPETHASHGPCASVSKTGAPTARHRLPTRLLRHTRPCIVLRFRDGLGGGIGGGVTSPAPIGIGGGSNRAGSGGGSRRAGSNGGASCWTAELAGGGT